MKQQWHITVWGVRGSAPRPAPDCLEYGGNTVCAALEHAGGTVILDAGTGLAFPGQSLAQQKDVKRLDLLISHFHIDHLMGLFSFAPLFRPELTVHLYGGAGLGEALHTLVAPPYWPLGLRGFPARLEFHEIAPGDSFALEGLSVSTMAGNHPGGSILYRLDGAGKRITYALDCETDERIFPALAEFARGSDLVIWDAGFAPGALRPGWGHSTWEQGLTLGRAAKAGRVLMTHYDWGYTDEFLHRQEQLAGQYEKQAGRNDICRFAKEGMVITL